MSRRSLALAFGFLLLTVAFLVTVRFHSAKAKATSAGTPPSVSALPRKPADHKAVPINNALAMTKTERSQALLDVFTDQNATISRRIQAARDLSLQVPLNLSRLQTALNLEGSIQEIMQPRERAVRIVLLTHLTKALQRGNLAGADMDRAVANIKDRALRLSGQKMVLYFRQTGRALVDDMSVAIAQQAKTGTHQ